VHGRRDGHSACVVVEPHPHNRQHHAWAFDVQHDREEGHNDQMVEA